jgi:hypothetical protein
MTIIQHAVLKAAQHRNHQSRRFASRRKAPPVCTGRIGLAIGAFSLAFCDLVGVRKDI